MRTLRRVLAALVVLLPAAAAPAAVAFERLSLEQGLSQSIIEGILQDRRGFLWLATEDGLNRWDGHRFTVFRNVAGDARSLSYNDLKCLLEDRSGAIWVGTFEGGLNRFDPSTGRFERFRHDARDPSSLAHDDVRALLVDGSGVLWAGTYGGGLDRFDAERRAFEHVPSSENAALVSALLEDRSGTVWAGTYGAGLLAYDAATGRLARRARCATLPSPLVKALAEDHEGHLWVATDGGGLARLDRKTGAVEVHRHDSAVPRSLATDRVWSVFEDRSKVLWVGTYGGGLNALDLGRKKFLHVRHDPRDPSSLGHDIVWSFHEDADGTLWVATDSGGLQRWDRRRNVFRGYRHDPSDPASLAHDTVRVVYGDAAGNLWVGTNGGGLDRLDRATGRFEHNRHDPADPGSLAHDELRALYEDRSGTLWVGTNGGGLDRLDRASGAFTRWRADPTNAGSLSNDYVFALHEGSGGSLWAGTYGGGLNRLDRKTGRFERFTAADGLSSDAVYGILEDERGRLWVSTNRGLTCFDPSERTFHAWDVHDGLQSDEFNGGAFYRSARGEMFFGGIEGFNAFLPSEIVVRTDPAPVVLTELLLANRPVGAGRREDGRTLLPRFVGYADGVVLSHEDDVVSLEFAALHFSAPRKLRYAYRLDGFDREWIPAGADRRVATYTGLSPGAYLFRVKAANPDGVWGEEEARLRIVVTPPFWGTWWFRLAAGLALLGAAASFLRRRMRTVRLEAAMRAAHDAQMAVMPHEDPELPGFEVSGVCIPALEVGGDFFDYVRPGGDGPRLGIVVGDVSGKGTPAAMTAAMSGGMVNALVRAGGPLEEVAEQVNAALRAKIEKRMFAAVCLATLDPAARELTFVNAGLCEPLLRSGDTATYLAAEGTSFPLGACGRASYRSRTVALAKGDVLVFYTDGVPEAAGRGGAQWGYDAFAGFLRGLPAASLTARELRDAIVREVARVTGGPRPADDVAVVVVKAL